jgi:hypothetical protein
VFFWSPFDDLAGHKNRESKYGGRRYKDRQPGEAAPCHQH